MCNHQGHHSGRKGRCRTWPSFCNYICHICRETESATPTTLACHASLTKCPQIYRELFALPTSLSRLQAERQPLILCVSAVKPAHPPLQSPKNPQNSGDQHATIWLEASFEGPPPTPSTPFSASLKMNLSVLYIVPEVGAWSNADLRNYQ